MNFLNKKKNTKSKSSKYEREMSLSVSGISSRFDWVMTVLVGITILILLLIFSWRLFVRIDTGTYLDNSISPTQSKKVVDVDRLNRVVDMFEIRAERFKQLTNGMVLSGSSADIEAVENIATTSSETVEEAESENSFDQ